MENLIPYILKSGGILLFMLAVYHLLLRQETFYRHNRFYLLAGLVFSVLLPLITFTKVQWIEPAEASTTLPEIMQGLAQPVAESGFSVNWPQLFLGIYLAGAAIFLIRFLMDFADLRKTLRGKAITRSGAFKIVETNENLSPFSYFSYIVYNPGLYSKIELANIIEHEKVHCRQKHSLDVILSRIYCIVFWFNPFAWIYKKTIVQNLEFIADSEASGKIADRLSYQITLVKVTAHENCVAITNHFYQSLIKKRIVMLNKNRSNSANQWKYGIIVPVLTAFMLQFQVNVIAQTKAKNHQVTAAFSTDKNAKIDAFMVLPTTTDQELRSYEQLLEKQYAMQMKFSNITRENEQIKGFHFWYDDKNGRPQTLKVAVNKPEDLFFMIGIKKDKTGKNRLDVNTYNKNEPQSYSVKADTLIWHNNDIVKETSTEMDKKHKNMLIIIGDKEYMADDIVKGNFILEVDGSITTLSPEEGVKKYGERGKEGVMIVTGKAELVPKTKPATEFPKVVTLESGDQAVFLKSDQMKLPGYPTLSLDKAILFVNDVKYDNAKAVIEHMDLNRIKSIRIVENLNLKNEKEIQVFMKI